MLERNLRQVWDQLRGKKPQMRRFVEELRIKGLRGISDLRLPIVYPVSVLAGPNGCGKSTALFALACAYRVPGAGLRDFVPTSLLPDFKAAKDRKVYDAAAPAELSYSYVHDGERLAMRWARLKKSWNRSYLGKKKATQPEREVYLRTLRNLSNPSEVRSVLQLGRTRVDESVVDATLVAFAQQVLPFRYQQLVVLSAQRKGKDKDLLFAIRTDEGRYSEFHMSAGERAILRLSREISQLRGALILIDEIEAGLHPVTQQQLLLELQRMALRNELQVVVTTHSAAVLDAVPAEARLFLERTPDNVVQRPAFRDIVQRALYGRSFDKLSILCEDEEAAAVMRGVFDVVKPRLGLLDEDIEVSRDTGKSEFPAHVRTLARIGRLDAFLFVLDGDARGKAEADVREAAASTGQPISIVFLPGAGGPEAWAWGRMKATPGRYADAFGVDAATFGASLEDIERAFAGAADTASNKAKGQITTLASRLARPAAEICRTVARRELAAGESEITEVAQQVEERIGTWRSLKG